VEDTRELVSSPSVGRNLACGSSRRAEKAFDNLEKIDSVIVWGYSLPPTDVKAQLVFQLALSDRVFNLCVIDPSAPVRDRWRMMFPDAKFWEFETVEKFFDNVPRWWRDHPDGDPED